MPFIFWIELLYICTVYILVDNSILLETVNLGWYCIRLTYFSFRSKLEDSSIVLRKLTYYVKRIQFSQYCLTKKINVVRIMCENFRTITLILCKIQLQLFCVGFIFGPNCFVVHYLVSFLVL